MPLGKYDEAAAVRAIEDQWTGFRLFYGRIEGTWIRREATGTAIRTPLPLWLFNTVINTTFDDARANRLIDDYLAGYIAAGSPVNWWLGPSTTPGDMDRRLADRGLVRTIGLTGMAADLDQLPQPSDPPPGVTVGPLTDPADLDEWTDLVIDRFHFPIAAAGPMRDLFVDEGVGEDSIFRHFAAWKNSRIIATASVRLEKGSAGLNYVTTAQDHLCRGLGSLMTRTALAEAARLGYPLGVLHATESGVNIYARLGFKELCRLDAWLLKPGT